MSTRSTTHFTWKGESEAIIYRHTDGYPSGHGTNLIEFLRECNQLEDPRFSDPAYLAAKLVVWLAQKFNHRWRSVDGGYQMVQNESPLDFLSVGVVRHDPGDIDYRYLIACDEADGDGFPVVRCIRTYTGEEEPLPAPEEAHDAPA